MMSRTRGAGKGQSPLGNSIFGHNPEHIIFRKTGEADVDVDDADYMIYVNQAQYELRTGSAEVAIIYLNTAIALQPEDELPFLVRSKCLNK